MLQHFFELVNRLFDFSWDLVVLIPQLDLLKHRKRNWVDKHNASVDATRVYHQDLLIALLKTQKPRLRVLERLAVVQADIVLASFVTAYCDALLRESGVLLNVPNFQDPVSIQRINAATSLVTDHINNVIVFKRRLGAQVNAL